MGLKNQSEHLRTDFLPMVYRAYSLHYVAFSRRANEKTFCCSTVCFLANLLHAAGYRYQKLREKKQIWSMKYRSQLAPLSTSRLSDCSVKYTRNKIDRSEVVSGGAIGCHIFRRGCSPAVTAGLQRKSHATSRRYLRGE